MKYGLEDLKTVADELLDGLTVSPALREAITTKCYAQPKARRQKTWPLYMAASVAACAAALFLFSVLLRPASAPHGAVSLASNDGYQVTADSSAVPAPLDPLEVTLAQASAAPRSTAFVMPTSASDPSASGSNETVLMAGSLGVQLIAPEDTAAGNRLSGDGGAGYHVEQSESGLYGLQDSDDVWVIIPAYDAITLQGEYVILESGGNLTRCALCDLP